MLASPPSREPLDTDLVTRFADQVARRPDAVAVHHPTRRGRHAGVTFHELGRLADDCVHALASAGVRPGTRVCVLVPPGPESIALALALARLQAVVVDVPGAAPEVVIGTPRAHAARVLRRRGRPGVRITVGRRWFWGGHTLDRLVATAGRVRLPEPSPDAVAAVAFTSGSRPVELRARHLAARARLVDDLLDLGPGEAWLSTSPALALVGPLSGLRLVVPDEAPGLPAATIRRFGVAGVFASPAELDALSRRGVVLDSLRVVLAGGAPLDPRVAERLRRCLPRDARLYSVYGTTESSLISAIESRDLLGAVRRAAERGQGTCLGRPFDGNTVRVIRVADGPVETWSDDLVVPVGAVGEITVAGPGTGERHPGRDRETALDWVRDGDRVVHRTGDLGRFDEQGRLWFHGRKSQRVRAPGGELGTEEVEPVVNTVRGVRRSALVGVGEPGGQVPVVCVEPERGADPERVEKRVLALLSAYPHTAGIRHVLFHRGFPAGTRYRELLAEWAGQELSDRP
ncbi:AMP-binding protein [Saccharothrix syringae]|uniref:AMP-binding protein n=1 Tax=Saccharothrix syringae TaxID=103733 RepID=UPI0014771026|nr:AMP-binding protein [Saccharothrix syringae]